MSAISFLVCAFVFANDADPIPLDPCRECAGAALQEQTRTTGGRHHRTWLYRLLPEPTWWLNLL